MTDKAASSYSFGAVRISPAEGASATDLVFQARMIASEAQEMASDMAALLECEREVSPMTAHGIARLLQMSDGILGAAEAAVSEAQRNQST